MGSGTGKGSSSSKTSSQTTTNTVSSTVNTVDNRIVEGDNARVGGNVTVNPGDNSGTLNISTTDQGAVQAGLDLALESLGFSGDIFNQAIGFAKSTQSGFQSGANDLVSQSYSLADQARQSETSGAINNFAKLAAIVAVVGILAWVAVRTTGK